MRQKKSQRVYYDPSTSLNHKLPTWRSRGQRRPREEAESSQSAAKRHRPNEQREEGLMETLQQQFEETLSLRIQTCLEKGDDLEQLKDSCLNEKRLPRGVITGTEKRINAKAAVLESVLKRRTSKKSYTLWTDFVGAKYDEFTEVVRSRSESLASTVSIAKPSEETELTRACSASLASLIRKDLPEDIRTAFLDAIERTLISATDYVVEYSMQVRRLLLLLRTMKFVVTRNGDMGLQEAAGRNIHDILPSGFQIDGDVFNLSPPLGSSVMSNRNMPRQFNSLFNINHLQFIHSTCFGPHGVTESTLAKHPFHNAFTKILPRTRQYRPDMDTYVMKMSLSKYMTSFKNMWSIKGRMNKLLHHLINTLLKLHLAPIREKK
ncbi:hypothetical protein RMATCC62417_16107 [Rhizopus microsporus]|nr:hypothetical protein RMATCC62417_16107 [Rhizopus microsporus]